MKWIRKLLIWLLSLPIYFYRGVISPFTMGSCRHTPTCSQYALEALKIHGPFRGLLFATWRILRCNPWGTSGYDPVPPSGTKFSFNYWKHLKN